MAESLLCGMGVRGGRSKPSSAYYPMAERAAGQPTFNTQEEVVRVEVEDEVRQVHVVQGEDAAVAYAADRENIPHIQDFPVIHTV